jgi:hypothetical protein
MDQRPEENLEGCRVVVAGWTLGDEIAAQGTASDAKPHRLPSRGEKGAAPGAGPSVAPPRESMPPSLAPGAGID